MIKTLLRLIFFFICLGVVVWGIKKVPLNLPWNKIDLPSKTNLLESFPIKKPIVADENQIIDDINQYRQSNNLSPLERTAKLDQAAKARLASIITFNDYEGTQTGVTRESAVTATGYAFSWVGDLIILNTNPSIEDPVESWKSIQVANNTILEKNLSEVGIAIVVNKDTYSAYVMLASPRKITLVPKKTAGYSGPELWDAVNKSRVSHGVNELKQNDDFCTIAAIRLNQILDLGKLDGHAGFEPTLERTDLQYISEKYNISEFLISGYATPELAVKAWEDTLGHKKLLTGGEYVWGCIYAQNLFGVAIAGY